MMIRILLFALLGLSAASCEEVGYPAEFSVKVVDEEGNPIPDAPVKTSTFIFWDRSGQGFGKDIWQGPEAKTDENGNAVFEYKESKRGEFRITVFPVPEGYYKSNWPNLKLEKVVDGKWFPEKQTVNYVLKRKKNPIPMFAKSFYINHTSIPKIGGACGFDFERGDWVTPHGKGKSSDILFLLDVRKNKGIYDHDCSLVVSFPNAGDGIISAPNALHQGSELRLDHLAPTNGYKARLEKKAFANPVTKQITQGFETDQNYYLRVRTVLDEEGNVESAHYAKIYGDFEFWVDANMRFTYYFNAKANDRNLEFDTTRNLMKSEQITNP